MKQATRVLWVPSAYLIFKIVESKWFTIDVGKELGHIDDCYIVAITMAFETVKLLERKVQVMKVRMISSPQTCHCFPIMKWRR